MELSPGLLLTSAFLLVACSADLKESSSTTTLAPVSSEKIPVTQPAPGSETGAGSGAEGPDSETDPVDTGPAITVSCQDEVHCHCTLRNGTVDIQCRYGDQNVILRWNMLSSRPSPDTRFEIDLQTRGQVKVMPSFLDLRLNPPPDGRPCVTFIVRDAALVDALYASDETFSTEWHLEGVNLRSLNAEQLSPPPHKLLMTVRESRVGELRLPPLLAGSRLTLDACRVTEVTGLPPPPGDVPPLPPPAPAPEGSAGRPEVIVRNCSLDTMRTAAVFIEDVEQRTPTLLFSNNVIGEMERAAITVRSSSCQLTFSGNEVFLLQTEVFSVVGGALRLSNNTLHVPHASALRGFCGQISLLHNDVLAPPTFGALHFDVCVRYSLLGNTFRCPCDGVAWLAIFERRRRPSGVEMFYERLLRDSFCSTPQGKMPMKEFVEMDDCSGMKLRSTLVVATASLGAVVLLLLLALLVCCCCYRRRRGSTIKLQPTQVARLRRPTNLYSSDISAPISKTTAASTNHHKVLERPVTAPSSASLSALSGVDARQLGHYVTLESEEDDGLYATIVYKKRRAPNPPPGSTPRPIRAAPPGKLNRCISEDGIRLPVYSSLQSLPLRKFSGAGAGTGVEGQPKGIAEEAENPYLIPDGTASDYTEVPPLQLYEEIIPVEVEQGTAVRSGWAAPQQGKTCKDSGIGDDFCLEAMPQEGVYSPPVRPRRP